MQNECESKLKELSDKEKGNEVVDQQLRPFEYENLSKQFFKDKQANMQRNYENLQQQMNELKDEKLKAEMKHDEELMKYRGELDT